MDKKGGRGDRPARCAIAACGSSLAFHPSDLTPCVAWGCVPRRGITRFRAGGGRWLALALAGVGRYPVGWRDTTRHRVDRRMGILAARDQRPAQRVTLGGARSMGGGPHGHVGKTCKWLALARARTTTRARRVREPRKRGAAAACTSPSPTCRDRIRTCGAAGGLTFLGPGNAEPPCFCAQAAATNGVPEPDLQSPRAQAISLADFPVSSLACLVIFQPCSHTPLPTHSTF